MEKPGMQGASVDATIFVLLCEICVCKATHICKCRLCSNAYCCPRYGTDTRQGTVPCSHTASTVSFLVQLKHPVPPNESFIGTGTSD